MTSCMGRGPVCLRVKIGTHYSNHQLDKVCDGTDYQTATPPRMSTLTNNSSQQGRRDGRFPA